MANKMRISVENETILTDARLNGVDTTNVLLNTQWGGTGSYRDQSYTATQDCWVNFDAYGTNVNTWCKINGSSLVVNTGGYQQHRDFFHLVPLKKGDILTINYYYSVDIKVFGVKR